MKLSQVRLYSTLSRTKEEVQPLAGVGAGVDGPLEAVQGRREGASP